MDSTSIFFEKIASINLNTSNYVIIIFSSILLIILVVCLYVFRDSFSDNKLKTDYIWYGIIGILNLLNILFIAYYYTSNSGKYIGDPGKKGDSGKKGERGNFITCSFCADNIYLEPTKRYNKIASLDVSGVLFLNHLVNSIISVEVNVNNLSASEMDPSALINSMFQPPDSNNPLYFYFMNQYNQIPEIITTYINSLLLDGTENEIGSFYRPGSVEGHFAFGDTAFNGTQATEMNGFMASGNIRNPVRYELLFPFYITTTNYDDGSNNNQLMKVFTIIPPDGFVALGDIIEIGKNTPPLNAFACITEACSKKVPREELELVFAHCSIKDIDTILLIPSIYDFIEGSLNMTFFTVWRTPMNTLFINNGEDFVNNTLGYNILNANPAYLDETGSITNEGIQKINDDLVQKLLPANMIAFFVISYYTAQIAMNLPNLLETRMNTFKDGYKSKGLNIPSKDITAFQISQTAFETQYTKDIINKTTITMNNTHNAYDVLMVLFGTDLTIMLAFDDVGISLGGMPIITVQKIFLKMLKTIYPPNRDVIIPKNECVAYYRIDEQRQKLIIDVADIMRKYKFQLSQFSSNPTGMCSNWETVSNFINQSITTLDKNLNQIPDYINKLERQNYDDFNNSRLSLILTTYTNILNMITNNCPINTS